MTFLLPLPPCSSLSPQLVPNRGQPPTCAPPLSRGMWASSNLLNRGIQEAGTQGGTHEMGGPHGASQKWATTKVVAHFPSSLSTTDHLSSKCQHSEPCQDPKTRLGDKRPHGGPNDHARGPTTTCNAQRRHVRPDNKAKGPMIACKAPRHHVRPNHDANGPTMTPRAEPRHEGAP